MFSSNFMEKIEMLVSLYNIRQYIVSDKDNFSIKDLSREKEKKKEESFKKYEWIV